MPQSEMLARSKVTRLRAWIEADGITIPAVAKGSDIQVSDNKIVMFFSDSGGELYATSLGKRYTIQEQVQINANFTVKSGRLVPEIPIHSYAEIKAELAKQAGAYYGNPEDPNPITVVGEITGKDQIAIWDGGIATLSKNLTNTLVKVIALPIVFPQVVSVSSETVETFVVKIVCIILDKPHLATVGKCELIQKYQESNVDRRRVEFKYDAGNVKLEELKA